MILNGGSPEIASAVPLQLCMVAWTCMMVLEHANYIASLSHQNKKNWKEMYLPNNITRDETPGRHEPPLCRHKPPVFARQTEPPLCRKSLCYTVNEPPLHRRVSLKLLVFACSKQFFFFEIVAYKLKYLSIIIISD